MTAWRKRDDAPTGRDVDVWRAYMEANDLGDAGPKTQNGDLKAERLKRQIRLHDLEIAKRERTSIDRSAVDSLLHHIAAQQRSALYQKLETELPPKLDGLPAAEVRTILRTTADELCDIMGTLVEKWRAE